MQTLYLNLEYCHGIRALQTEFDFRECNAYVIYAPNGSMKSSLARTFEDLAEGTDSRDRVFPHRKTIRRITDENGDELPAGSVLVLPPYDEMFGHSEKTSTLLVQAKLRKKYESLQEKIDRAKDSLLKALRKRSGIRNVEREFSLAFTPTADSESFVRALVRVREEVQAQPDAALSTVDYKVVFDEKVLAFLAKEEVTLAIEEYIVTYNELLDASTYFQRGVFDYHNASTIARTLASNGFFDAHHSVSFNADTRTEITTEKALRALIDDEREEILTDAQLRKQFAAVEKLITKNASLRAFQAYLAENEFLLPLLGNIEQLREDVWKSYLKSEEALYLEVLEEYQAARQEMKEIESEASQQRTAWERVIEIFNDRFFVPFELTVRNRLKVMLGGDSLLDLDFVFDDGNERAQIERPELLQVLSTGEKKALYILNILFEIEVRKQARQETVLVVDDIADSFDYKNKYAIIHYLKDITGEDLFKLIILTHNFDFFRTVNSRFVRYSNCRMASRSPAGVVLEQATGIRNVFVNDWKTHFYDDARKRIASIPFIRNIVEYTRGQSDEDYSRLTSLLHWKEKSNDITQADLDQIFGRTFQNHPGAWSQPHEAVHSLILDEADRCLDEDEGANLEIKIMLAIAIRLVAERYMIGLLGDERIVDDIRGNQTARLLEKVKEGEKAEDLSSLEKVVLMTPENIHLNSFMYEPILDMSDESLRELYREIRSLAEGTGATPVDSHQV